MKRIILTACVAVLTSTGFSQLQKRVEGKISQVTVFLSKAQVIRDVKTSVAAGETEVVVTGLTSSLDPESIQVSGKGRAVIMGMRHQQNFLNEQNQSKKLRMLKDSLEYYQKQLILEQSHKEILNKEEQMLLSNQKIGGGNQNLTVAELRAMADFYRGRLGEIVASRVKQDDKIKSINASIVRLQRQINEESGLLNQNTSEVVVVLSTEAATQVDLQVSYVVNNAGWHPIYDLRAIDTKSPIQIGYKANVIQRTGESWDNVKLKLSTANPTQGGLKPELYTWFLDFYQPQISRALSGKTPGVRMNAAAPEAMSMAEEEVAMDVTTLDDYVQTIQTSLNTEFDIALPYTIESSGKPTVVDIRKEHIDAQYSYSAVPKLDPDAFLMARATGWEDLNLLPGEANIFFEGTFVGKTYIDPNNINDTLSISLGRDKRIVVKRQQLKDLTTRKAIGINIREQQSWEISVRNTKSESISITIEDQIPIPKNSQIELGLVDVGGARTESNTGKLTWQLDVPPGETKKVMFKYEVKYPKDKKIIGL
ncbi:MAG: DUF4139 domain-containing protein [Cyclobacteriaceae bacterium]